MDKDRIEGVLIMVVIMIKMRHHFLLGVAGDE